VEDARRVDSESTFLSFSKGAVNLITPFRKLYIWARGEDNIFHYFPLLPNLTFYGNKKGEFDLPHSRKKYLITAYKRSIIESRY
jgi:hypothetical protein